MPTTVDPGAGVVAAGRMSAIPQAAPPVRLRSLALPAEHGSWGFLLEPIALALLLCPTRAGAWLAVAAACAFLARHPLKLVLGDRRRGSVAPRTAVAARMALAYAAGALAAEPGLLLHLG